MPVKNDAVSAEIRTAPASAVPIESPRLENGVLEPADLAALLVGHRGDGDRAELRRERADAETGEEHRPGDDLGARRRRRARRRTRRDRGTARGTRAGRPGAATRCGNTFGIPTAAITSVIDSGRIRTPVSIAESPSAIERNSGTAKNRPAWSRYWKKNAVSPLRSSRTRRIAGSSSAAWPVSRRCFSQARNPSSTAPPPRISQITGDRPSHVGRVRLRLHEPPGAGAQDPVDDRGRARAPRARCRRGRGGRLPPSACRRCAG